MTDSFSYKTTYLLDKAHFQECFEQSVTKPLTIKDYTKAGVMSLAGLFILLFTAIEPYAAWFLVALGALEAVSLYYRKPWWVLRQLMSRSANSEVTLEINEQSIENNTFYVKSSILWQDITSIEETEEGFLIFHQNNKSYLSRRALSEEAVNFIGIKQQRISVKHS